VIGNLDEQNPNELVPMSISSNRQSFQFTIPAVFVSTNAFKGLNVLMQGGELRVTLDSQGSSSVVGSADTGIITNLIRMILFLAAGFPSLWMCWLSCFFVGNAFQHCLDKYRRRNRLGYIPIVKYDSVHCRDKDNPDFIHNTSCVICLDEFMDGQSVKVLPCSHGFCSNCIQSWLTDRSDLCPICKRSILGTPDLAVQRRRCCCARWCIRRRRHPASRTPIAVEYAHLSNSEDLEGGDAGATMDRVGLSRHQHSRRESNDRL